jgi:hypothetical protein
MTPLRTTLLAGAETQVAESAIHCSSSPSERNMIQPSPPAWDPGLENGELRLGDVYRTLPTDPAGSIQWSVKTLENPRSPFAIAGAVDSFARGCIHIVLGRGLLTQDQAFVLGFTMGAARAPGWQRRLFRQCARHLYTGDHRFSEQDAQVFDHSFDAARRTSVFALHRVDFKKLLERRLTDVRRYLGIDTEVLRRLYATEQERWPLGQARQPLPQASRDQRAEEGRVVYLSEIRRARAVRSAPRSRSAALAQVVVVNGDRNERGHRFMRDTRVALGEIASESRVIEILGARVQTV